MPPRAHSAWLRTLGQLALILGVAALSGLLIGHPWPVITLAALGVVAWHYWRLRGVLLRLTARQRLQPPIGEGIWNELDRLLHRSQLEMRARKKRLIGMLRAYRAAAAAMPDAIVVVERNNQRIRWFNESATGLLQLHYPRDIGAPLASGFTRRGVTTIISSRSSWWKFRFLKNTPITGRSPSSGTLLTLLTVLRLTSPPITKLWPSRNSTVVEARRTISAGTEMPLLTVTV